jgi:hypothetical protein
MSIASSSPYAFVDLACFYNQGNLGLDDPLSVFGDPEFAAFYNANLPAMGSEFEMVYDFDSHSLTYKEEENRVETSGVRSALNAFYFSKFQALGIEATRIYLLKGALQEQKDLFVRSLYGSVKLIPQFHQLDPVRANQYTGDLSLLTFFSEIGFEARAIDQISERLQTSDRRVSDAYKAHLCKLALSFYCATKGVYFCEFSFQFDEQQDPIVFSTNEENERVRTLVEKLFFTAGSLCSLEMCDYEFITQLALRLKEIGDPIGNKVLQALGNNPVSPLSFVDLDYLKV